jgi:hypothetical protein
METQIRMIFCEEAQTWTIVIDGKPSHNLSGEAAGDLIEYAMLLREQGKTIEPRAGCEEDWPSASRT